MFEIYLCLTTQHDWRLLGVALLVCAAACGAAAYLYSKTPGAGVRRRAWLGLVAVVAGAGAWTTHFVAMLAFQAALPTGYAAGGAIASLMIAVGSAYLAFSVAAERARGAVRAARRTLGGVTLGVGIAAMHYVGMSAYRPMGVLVWRPDFVLASVALGAVFCVAALWSVEPGSRPARRVLGAAMLLAAIACLHFTGMSAFWVRPDPAVTIPLPLLSERMMGYLVAGGALALIAAGVGGGVAAVLSRNRDLERLCEALDAMTDGLAFFDPEDRLVAWNSRYAGIRKGGALTRGMSFADILRTGVASGHYPDAASRSDAWIQERLARRGGGEPVELRSANGRWLRIHDQRTRDGGLITVLRDVTDEKKAEAAMAHARDLAQEADRIKSEFLANMSHEIRTPMNGILGMNALLLMTNLTPDQRRYAEVVRASADELMSMINDILDVAKLEAGQAGVSSAVFRLQDLLREAEAAIAPAAAAKGLRLEIAADAGAERLLLGDPGRLRQVIGHLLSNAVKFTERGEVRLDVRSEARDGGRTWMRIEVSDTGIGVGSELKGKLFEPFRQADGSTTRAYGGAGLGLAICRHAVRLMGGIIGVLDRPGGGSVFWLEVTLREAQAGRMADAA